METTKEKKTPKRIITENKDNEKQTIINEPEEKNIRWELKFAIGAFGIGTLLLILKIIGIF